MMTSPSKVTPAAPAQLTVLGTAEPVREPEPNHEIMALFTPAPAQMDGQLGMTLDS
jgi:hypothetical protein